MLDHERFDFWQDLSGAFEVAAADLVVATPEGADHEALGHLSALLQRVCGVFGMEAVFVSEWVGAGPIVRPKHDAGANTLRALYGARLLDTPALKRAKSRFDAVPVLSGDGADYGTLCCRQPLSGQEKDDGKRVEALESVARLIAEWFGRAELAPAMAG
jgi:hypothetical protein